jgi:hypothetical protein
MEFLTWTTLQVAASRRFMPREWLTLVSAGCSAWSAWLDDRYGMAISCRYGHPDH